MTVDCVYQWHEILRKVSKKVVSKYVHKNWKEKKWIVHLLYEFCFKPMLMLKSQPLMRERERKKMKSHWNNYLKWWAHHTHTHSSENGWKFNSGQIHWNSSRYIVERWRHQKHHTHHCNHQIVHRRISRLQRREKYKICKQRNWAAVLLTLIPPTKEQCTCEQNERNPLTIVLSACYTGDAMCARCGWMDSGGIHNA